jgi:orotidine-5'-phosphate decarboxylase
MTTDARDRLIVALDVPDLPAAERLLDALAGTITWAKVGLEVFNAAGPAAIAAVKSREVCVFYDSKFHDIPNTVAGAARQAARMGADMFNVHATGGEAMMAAAVRAARESGDRQPLVIAVTVLTSIDQEMLREQLAVAETMDEHVVRLAETAQRAGCDGVVASPREIELVKGACGDDFLVVTPGIRPSWAAANLSAALGKADDQKRTLGPREAIAAGADYIVVGRPIAQADDPRAAAQRVLEEMSS